MRSFVGIDNGCTGQIACVIDGRATYTATPVKKDLSYTKARQWVHRVDTDKLEEWIRANITAECFCFIERPMVHPGRFKATISAIRALEATLIVVERLKIPMQYIDSREWQKALLPKGIEKEELKVASLQVGKRLFPYLNIKEKDADGLLIAYYAYKKATGGL